MDQDDTRTVEFRMHPDLLSKHLGSDLYPSPARGLIQLVENCLDASCSSVDISIEYNELEGPERVTISDDGRGMSPEAVDRTFGTVGHHVAPAEPIRETIGSRGIGRFAVFALAVESEWETVADVGDSRIRQWWQLAEGLKGITVHKALAPEAKPGTTVRLVLRNTDAVVRLFSSVDSVKRAFFNGLAEYLLRYEGQVRLAINGEALDPKEYVEQSSLEMIDEAGCCPAARMRHLLLSSRVDLGLRLDQEPHCLLKFTAHGSTIADESLEGEPIPGRKYLGLVDSPYFEQLVTTSKSEFANMDERFVALKAAAADRARDFIEKVRGQRASSFLEVARTRPFYPFKGGSESVLESRRQIVYDSVLAALDQQYGIGRMPLQLQALIFALVERLLQSEDLASVLTSVLGLRGEEITRLADLLRVTSLRSIIVVSELLVNRFRFLRELRELVYGDIAKRVLERKQLHKILEGHTWLFGEQYNLMGSDVTLYRLLEEVRRKLRLQVDDGDEEEDEAIEVDRSLRDVPDLYLAATRCNQGDRYFQHLIVEIKAPSVRITSKHVSQLKRYAHQIVRDPSFGQRSQSHRFTFVVVSSDISERVKAEYQRDAETGLLGRPSLAHETEYWALRWSDYIDRREQELHFLQQELEINADPKDLEYLRKAVGRYLPEVAAP